MIKPSLNGAQFWLINDPPSHYYDLIQERLLHMSEKLRSLTISADQIIEHELFERTETIVTCCKQFISIASKNIALDITSFPKRFFFPLIRIILSHSSVENFIITYTRASHYATTIAEDPDPVSNIPLFAPTTHPEPPTKMLFVGIGFDPLGLPEKFEHDLSSVAIKFLFPFPPGPPHFQRNWEFIRTLEKSLAGQGQPAIIRVNTWDISECFDHIVSLTQSGSGMIYSEFAPYGPKPMSVAMCLFAQLAEMPVFYTQPKVYNPGYSEGIKVFATLPETYAYCIRLCGQDLFTI
ncbi:MAG: hypothetical protein WAN11_00385 [Syntrophobacteraceae bacterium]